MKRKRASSLMPSSSKRSRARRTDPFYESVAGILREARARSYRAVNIVMVEAYWHVGRSIVEQEQQGRERAGYGAALLESLSIRLTREFGRGFDERELRRMRQFFLAFPIRGALRPELSWTHYRLLIRLDKSGARVWYTQEAIEQNWSTRALERQIHSHYYERMLMSRNKGRVEREMREQAGPLSTSPQDFIKDPYVLDFLGLKDHPDFHESDLEQAIIGKLQAFMLELGKGFAFVGRQQRIGTETKDFYIDLVFYNYLLKCFVLVDLKTAELTHQDIGQMDMYVRLFEDTVKRADDNPTVGIILCADKDHTLVKYSVLHENSQLFASKYMLYLPTEDELKRELERERARSVRESCARYQVEPFRTPLLAHSGSRR